MYTGAVSAAFAATAPVATSDSAAADAAMRLIIISPC
jgi:hypothetical protein